MRWDVSSSDFPGDQTSFKQVSGGWLTCGSPLLDGAIEHLHICLTIVYSCNWVGVQIVEGVTDALCFLVKIHTEHILTLSQAKLIQVCGYDIFSRKSWDNKVLTIHNFLLAYVFYIKNTPTLNIYILVPLQNIYNGYICLSASVLLPTSTVDPSLGATGSRPYVTFLGIGPECFSYNFYYNYNIRWY